VEKNKYQAAKSTHKIIYSTNKMTINYAQYIKQIKINGKGYQNSSQINRKMHLKKDSFSWENNISINC